MNSRLEASWALLGAFLRIHSGIWWQILAKLGRRLAKLGQSWRQIVTKMGNDIFKMGHDSCKIPILDSGGSGSFGVVLGAFLNDFGTMAGE